MTPYDRIRMVIEGTINSSQTWSTSLTVTGEPTSVALTPNQGYLDTWIQNRVVNVRDFFTVGTSGSRVSDLFNAATLVTGLKAYLIPAGSDTASLLSEANFGAAIPGTGVSNHPAQTACVASLRSTVPGRSGRGRMYLPATGAAIGATMQFSNTICTGVAGRVAQLAADLGTSSYQDAPLKSIVASTAGARQITRVEVDNDPDTQRRRSDKLIASFTAVSTVTQ